MSTAVYLVVVLVLTGLHLEPVQCVPVQSPNKNQSVSNQNGVVEEVSKLKDSCREIVFKDCCEVNWKTVHMCLISQFPFLYYVAKNPSCKGESFTEL